jgi:hypothetical protein
MTSGEYNKGLGKWVKINQDIGRELRTLVSAKMNDKNILSCLFHSFNGKCVLSDYVIGCSPYVLFNPVGVEREGGGLGRSIS